MNIKEELTCKCCNEIYQQPITLTCCGENICIQHIERLSSTKTFTCPLCNQENSHQNFFIDRLLVKLIEKELHKFEFDPKYEGLKKSLKKEIDSLALILKDPENVIYEEMCELKRQVDLDREQLKSKIDSKADDFIQQLEAYEKTFKTECKKNVDSEKYNSLVESSRKHLTEYEHCLSMFSSKTKCIVEQSKQVEKAISVLKQQIKELKNVLFLNKSFKYQLAETSVNGLYGNLIIKVRIL